MILKNGTLIFRFLEMYGMLDTYRSSTDICIVVRHFLIGVVLTMFIVAIVVSGLIVILDPILSIFLAIYYDIKPAPFFSEISLNIGLVLYTVLFFYGLYRATKYSYNKTIRSSIVQDNEQIASLKTISKAYYKSFKGKYCLKIDIK